MTDDRTLWLWFGSGWITHALWADGGEALGAALKCFAPAEADPETILLDGLSLQVRDPERGVKVLVSGYARRRQSA